ncbi:MAG: hypothetical protein MRY83_03540, partial [Flavobacteriales bacterium]|nr:hypothetical protein [Flavobacteriales bacterium]
MSNHSVIVKTFILLLFMIICFSNNSKSQTTSSILFESEWQRFSQLITKDYAAGHAILDSLEKTIDSTHNSLNHKMALINLMRAWTCYYDAIEDKGTCKSIALESARAFENLEDRPGQIEALMA